MKQEWTVPSLLEALRIAMKDAAAEGSMLCHSWKQTRVHNGVRTDFNCPMQMAGLLLRGTAVTAVAEAEAFLGTDNVGQFINAYDGGARKLEIKHYRIITQEELVTLGNETIEEVWGHQL